MNIIITLIYFVLILGVIILVHEFGHFIFAKMFGVYVYEFSLGMGPKLFSKKDKKKETEYCIRAIPIGGFVQLAGEEVEDDSKIPKNRKLYSKPVWQRFLIMFFGAGNNFLLALLLFFSVGLFFGSPIMDPVVTGVEEGYPIYEAGIRNGDTILEINGAHMSTIDDVQLYLTLAQKDEESTIKIKDTAGEVKEVKVTPMKIKEDGEVQYRFGVGFRSTFEHGFVPAVRYMFQKTGAALKQMVIVLKSLFTGELGLKSMSGPVGIYSIVGESRNEGWATVFQLVALLSVNVGFINLIPFPAFDGGRILFLLIEKIKGSPVKAETENMIHNIGFMLLMLLMLYITFNDILKLF